MATNATQRIGGTTGVSSGQSVSRTFYHIIDIADAITKGGALASADKVTVFTPDIDTYIELLRVEAVTTLDLGTTPRLDVGDGSSDTLFVNNATTVTAGTDFTIATVGKLYTAAGSIFAKLSNASGTIATGKLRFVFRVTDVQSIALASPPSAGF